MIFNTVIVLDNQRPSRSRSDITLSNDHSTSHMLNPLQNIVFNKYIFVKSTIYVNLTVVILFQTLYFCIPFRGALRSYWNVMQMTKI